MSGVNKKEILAFVLGGLIGAVFTQQFLVVTIFRSHDEAHQITQPGENYHVHADFLVYVNDEKLDRSSDKYMTTGENTLHRHAHLHDGNGEVKHIHEKDITFAEFLASLDIVLDENCVTINQSSYCADNENILALYVNHEPYSQPIATYVPIDDDSILLYYGQHNPEKITNYINEMGDDACYYSGTCPERGVAPPESCGLTCEL